MKEDALYLGIDVSKGIAMTHVKRGTAELSVAMIGSKFMGRAHSNAWSQAGKFFDLPMKIRMHAVCARDAKATRAFAARWGWANWSTDWESVVEDDAIELVDVATPNSIHAEQAIAALEAGKHVACEKPLAGTIDDARAMLAAAKKVKRKGVRTFVWYNYRRCPAVALAHQLVREGRLGRIYHVRAAYLQDWGGPDTPLLWRFRKDAAGSGAHGDLNAHIIDMARFITGDAVTEVVGAIAETFIKKREIIEEARGALRQSGRGGRKKAVKRYGRSTVDDCVLFLARFNGGATGSFEATRLAAGNKNRNMIEINGESGSIKFDFERMNELKYYDAREGSDAAMRGWTTIMCTSAAGNHPYSHAWWPDAHVLGYEHGFVNEAADIVSVLGGGEAEVPLPDFEDAFETHLVLEAAMVSAREKRNVMIRELR